MVEAKDVAFVLHEEWRKTRLKEDGTYEPRWKSINDAKFIEELNKEELPVYVRKTEGGYEIDIANASYNLLSADWQNENKAAAEVVAGLVNSGKEFSRDEVGEIVHNAWLERNSWAKGGELGVPFAQLPKEEQDKDIVQYEIAKTMSQAERSMSIENEYISEDKENRKNCNETGLDYGDMPLENTVAWRLQWSKKNGENIVIKVKGVNLYSMYDNADTCFLKVYGKTLKEFKKQAKSNYDREIERRMKMLSEMAATGKATAAISTETTAEPIETKNNNKE